MNDAAILRKIRWAVAVVILGLIFGGVTAFPLQRELELVASIRGVEHATPTDTADSFDQWILIVRNGLRESYAAHPWLAYGTDWLAFAHLVIAVFFIGALIDPVRNIWVIKAGLVGCILVVPLALICGGFRQIPIGWRFIDCSFGIVGLIPLSLALRWARALEQKRG